METKRQPKYWLCDRCADLQGLVPFKTGNTKILGLCGHCTRPDESLITPIVDFKRKKKQEI